MTNFNDKPNRNFFQIEKFNHLTKKAEGRKSFETKRKANKWLKDNAEKRGYDYFAKDDRSIEFNPCY